MFCGEKPSNKNKEHVVPQWLIKMTGDLNRRISLGVSFDKDGELEHKEFSFNSATLPACSACNSQFGELECKVKPILSSLMSGLEVNAHDLSLLLDWFDKVRVGLWLLVAQHHGNPFADKPNFQIKQRIGLADRCLIIRRVTGRPRGLTFTGVQSSVFMHMPSAFSMTVNDYMFTNISTAFLVSEALGFPYSIESFCHPDGKGMVCKLSSGHQRISEKLLPNRFSSGCVIVAQAIIDEGSLSQFSEHNQVTSYYNQHALKKGRSNIYVQNEGSVSELTGDDNFKLKLIDVLNYKEWSEIHAVEMYGIQLWLHNSFTGKLDLLSPEHQQQTIQKLKYIEFTTLIEYLIVTRGYQAAFDYLNVESFLD